MKIFVIHHPGNYERRVTLESQLRKFKLTDVEWVTSYPKESLVKIKEISGTKIPLGYVSCSMKHYDALQRMLDQGLGECIIFEDDVILTDYFDVDKIPKHFPYVKLGKGVDDMNIPLGDTPIQVLNNGGSEAYYVRSDFAKEYLKNLDIGWSNDIEQHAFLIKNNIPLICVPMCYQTFETSVHEDKTNDITWQQYIQNYMTSKKKSFSEWKDYVSESYECTTKV